MVENQKSSESKVSSYRTVALFYATQVCNANKYPIFHILIVSIFRISNVSYFEWGGRVGQSTILALWVENPILCHPLHLPIYCVKIGWPTFFIFHISQRFFLNFLIENLWYFAIICTCLCQNWLPNFLNFSYFSKRFFLIENIRYFAIICTCQYTMSKFAGQLFKFFIFPKDRYWCKRGCSPNNFFLFRILD